MRMIIKINLVYIFISLSLLMNGHSFNQFSSQLKLIEKSDPQFVLITMLYNEKNKNRIDEYITCLKRNLEHPLIKTIHILYDTTTDSEVTVIKDFLNNHQLPITFINRRGTYQDCFDLANNHYPNKTIIIANADIYFNYTLNYLLNYDLTNKFLAVTRWDELSDGTLKLFGHHVSDTQDAWIFKTPLKQFANKDIQMGVLDCDGRIAFQANQAGLKLLNPCKTLQCCHLHLSNVRNYGSRNGSYPWHEALLIPWSDLIE